MSLARIRKGSAGEEIAARFLVEQGFKILAVNWKNPAAKIQIDMVASFAGRAYIVEVKHHRWTGSGFECLLHRDQRRRLLAITLKLHRARFAQQAWGFLWVWVRADGSCEILERTDL